MDVEITYTPSGPGEDAGVLEILSNDPLQPRVDVDLSGTGATPQDPLEEVAQILEFMDNSVADGSLVGAGPGNSAEGRLKALRNMIAAVSSLITAGDYDQACRQLLDAYHRCDGLPQPPDFVGEPAAPQMALLLLDLCNTLGCNGL